MDPLEHRVQMVYLDLLEHQATQDRLAQMVPQVNLD